jgi:hypothetical protein
VNFLQWTGEAKSYMHYISTRIYSNTIHRAGAGSRQGRCGRAVVRRSRSGPRPRPTRRPPPPPLPPPPHLTTADNASADADANAAAAVLANINESPATRTRRQLMLAIQSGCNAAAGCRDCDDNVLDNSPARRTRQRLRHLDAVSVNTTGTSNAYMRRLFGAQTGAGSDRDSNFNDEDPYEDDDHSHKEEQGGSGSGSCGWRARYGRLRRGTIQCDQADKCWKEWVA